MPQKTTTNARSSITISEASEDDEPSRILLATASKHGSTEEIGTKVAEILSRKGYHVDTISVDEDANISAYDVVIIGSAVYAGSWMRQADQFLRHNADDLAARPIWLFSSGPVGDDANPDTQEIMHMNEYMPLTKCVEHKIFCGNISADKLSLAEKLVIKTLKVQYGDYRDWDEITKWARSIARHLQKAPK